MKNLMVGTYSAHVTTLGPGKRFCLWLQGCNRRCEGCTSPNFQSTEGGTEIKPGVMGTLAWCSGDDGITVSGGEPMLQAEALSELLSLIKKVNPDMNVIIYTGFTYEELLAMNDEHINKVLALTDLLIDGAYVKELDDGKSLRGSSNQRVIPLTDTLKEYLPLYGQEGRESQLIAETTQYKMFAGIPTCRKDDE